jgi:hypothetical protein
MLMILPPPICFMWGYTAFDMGVTGPPLLITDWTR